MVRPNEVKARYLEIGTEHLLEFNDDGKTLLLPELTVNVKMQKFLGVAFLIVINPKLPGGGCHVVEAIDGADIFADLPIGKGLKASTVGGLSYIARVYELNT
jgi:hypothetical protein